MEEKSWSGGWRIVSFLAFSISSSREADLIGIVPKFSIEKYPLQRFIWHDCPPMFYLVPYLLQSKTSWDSSKTNFEYDLVKTKSQSTPKNLHQIQLSAENEILFRKTFGQYLKDSLSGTKSHCLKTVKIEDLPKGSEKQKNETHKKSFKEEKVLFSFC